MKGALARRWVLALAVLAASAGWAADELLEATGEVESVQLLDATALGGEAMLVLVLDDGHAFRLPGSERLAAGAGVRVAVEYRPATGSEPLPEACRVRVLALPVTVDGEEVLQQARRPFEVFRNSASACP